MGLFTMNKKMLPMKSHYFLFNGGTAPVVAFLSIIARQLGFSATLVGIIYTVLPVLGMIVKPIFGGIADKFKCKKFIFILFQVFTAVALLGINFIPEVPSHRKVHFACDGGAAVIDTKPNDNPITDKCVEIMIAKSNQTTKLLTCEVTSCRVTGTKMWTNICNHWHIPDFCKSGLSTEKTLDFVAHMETEKILLIKDYLLFPVKSVNLHNSKNFFPYCENVSMMCDMKCNDHTINNYITKNQQDDQVSSSYQFWLFFLLAALGWSSMAVVVSTSDAICFEMLEDKPHLYGNQRMWGSIGWGLFSVLAGYLVDSYSEGLAKKNYSSSFYLMFAVMVADILTSTRLQYTQQNISMSIIKDIGKLISRIRILVFMLWCLFVGMCTGIIWNFLFWMLEDVAKNYDDCNMHNWIKTLEGFVMGIQCLGGELPFFFLSGYIINRIGHVHCMSLVLLGVGIRYVLYSVLTNPWWILPIELMNGVTFGLFYATMASYASIVALPGTEATVQGLVGAVFEGLGVSLGSLIGGILFDKYGGLAMFRIFGISSLVCCLLHFTVQYITQLRRNDTKELNSSSSVQYTNPPTDDFDYQDDEQELTIVRN